MRDGAEEEFDPARQAQFVLQQESLHRGLATESLAESLLNAGLDVADILEVPAAESDRRMLASILLKEEEDLTVHVLVDASRSMDWGDTDNGPADDVSATAAREDTNKLLYAKRLCCHMSCMPDSFHMN